LGRGRPTLCREERPLNGEKKFWCLRCWDGPADQHGPFERPYPVRKGGGLTLLYRRRAGMEKKNLFFRRLEGRPGFERLESGPRAIKRKDSVESDQSQGTGYRRKSLTKRPRFPLSDLSEKNTARERYRGSVGTGGKNAVGGSAGNRLK